MQNPTPPRMSSAPRTIALLPSPVLATARMVVVSTSAVVPSDCHNIDLELTRVNIHRLQIHGPNRMRLECCDAMCHVLVILPPWPGVAYSEKLVFVHEIWEPELVIRRMQFEANAREWFYGASH